MKKTEKELIEEEKPTTKKKVKKKAKRNANLMYQR